MTGDTEKGEKSGSDPIFLWCRKFGSDPDFSPFSVSPVSLCLTFPVFPKVDVAVMAPEKIHEPFVVGVRKAEQGEHLLVTASRPFEAPPDQMLHLVSRDLTLEVGPRDCFPEVAGNHIFDGPRAECVLRQDDIAGLDGRASRRADRCFDDILQLADISRKTVRHELREGLAGDFPATAQDMLDQKRKVFQAPAERRNENRKYVQSIVEVFAKLASTHHGHEFAVGGGDDAQVQLAQNDVAQPAQLPVL